MENQKPSILESLKSSAYQIAEDEANIIDWKVKNEASMEVGIVNDLLFDSQSKAIRYLIIKLDDLGMNLSGKQVMIPIGIAELHETLPEVIVPNIHIDQFNALPNFDGNIPSNETERHVRQIIGSPAALRIEETIAELDQENFYNHDHFNENSFYNRLVNRPKSTFTAANREFQQESIHEMVENSKKNELHAADEQTGINSHNNEGKHIDLKEQQKEID